MAVEDVVFAQKHLGVALRKAQEAYGWEEDLVFTPHCLRNSMMVGKTQRVKKVVGALMCDVTAPTYTGHTKPKITGESLTVPETDQH